MSEYKEQRAVSKEQRKNEQREVVLTLLFATCYLLFVWWLGRKGGDEKKSKEWVVV